MINDADISGCYGMPTGGGYLGDTSANILGAGYLPFAFFVFASNGDTIQFMLSSQTAGASQIDEVNIYGSGFTVS